METTTREQLSNNVELLTSHTIIWRGLLLPGHECCHKYVDDMNWHLKGVAVFSYEKTPCTLSYDITCDAGWRTLSAKIDGRSGSEKINLTIKTDANQRWWLNANEVPEVKGCTDLDFSFSPSTNMIPIRRLNMHIGESMDIKAAWLRFPSFDLEPLGQRYSRTDMLQYQYESGGGSFVTSIRVNPSGLVVDYPDIWIAEAEMEQ